MSPPLAPEEVASPRLLALSFAGSMGAIGAFGPYFGLVMDRLGYSAAVIGGIWALMPLTRLVLTPAWAAVADRYRVGTRILQATTLGSVVAVAAMASGALPALGIAVAMVALSAMRAPVQPILDSLTVQTLEVLQRPPTEYGRIRLWGSVAFLVCAGTAAWAAEAVAWVAAPLGLAVAVWAVGFGVTLLLPRGGTLQPVAVGPALRSLTRRPGVGVLLASLCLYGMGMNAYDAWYGVHIEHLGLPSRYIGLALACGVVVEIGVMAVASRLLRDRDPVRLVVLAMGVASVRWALTATLTSAWLLTVLQMAHGVVYAVGWVALVELMRRLAPPEVRASAQGLLVMSAYGVGPLLTAGLAALLVDSLGTQALFAAASGLSAMAGLGVFSVRRHLQSAG